jgi:hypothetical protein
VWRNRASRRRRGWMLELARSSGWYRVGFNIIWSYDCFEAALCCFSLLGAFGVGMVYLVASRWELWVAQSRLRCYFLLSFSFSSYSFIVVCHLLQVHRFRSDVRCLGVAHFCPCCDFVCLVSTVSLLLRPTQPRLSVYDGIYVCTMPLRRWATCDKS